MSGIPPLPLMYPINPNPYVPFNIPRALDRISQKTDQSHDEILLTQQSLQQIMSHNASASEKITACTKTIVNQLDLFDDKLKQSGNAHENIRDNLQYFIDEQSNINDEMKQSRNANTTKLDKMRSDLLQNQSRNAHTTDAKVDTMHTHLRRFITKQSNINDQTKQSRNTSAIKLDQMHSDLSQCIENQSRNAQTIHADLHHFITKQSAINDEVHQYLKRKQNEEDKAKQIANDEKETFRLWLENIGLSQYYHHFISNGFENMRTVINVNMFILEMIGIEKIGHKISILNQIEKIGQRREQHMETTLAKNQIDYYNDGNNMEMEKLAKKYRDNARQLENEYRNSIKQIIQLNYSSNVDMHKHWTKGAVLRDYVLSKFEQRRKKEKLKDKIVVETIAIDCGRNQFIHDFIKLNERNPFASDPKINKTHVQSDMIRRIKIENHDRIPQLNGEYGVIAAIDIAKNTIIGEYTGKTILVEDLMMVGVESIVNEIDSYGFDAIIECEMTQRQWDAFNNNEDIETLPPPAKKRKLNHNNKVSGHKMISKKIDVIIDGWNAVPRSLLTCINDCRDDFQNREPTQNDKKYFNIKLMTCDVNGWPRVFGIALRDIAEGEELSTFYGSGFIEVQNKKNKLMQRKEQILKILSKHEMKIDI